MVMHTYVKEKIIITGEGDDAAARREDERRASFTNCKSEINDTERDKAKDIDIVMPMYSLIEYSNNYSKKSRS